MASSTDPYRTLGLPRGAPLAEVKKAYRRLAKENHPDAAGEAALPRFLAIQAAYDEIAGPGSAAATGRPGRRTGPTTRRPWEADPDRADATHRAYGGRSRRPRSDGPRPSAGGTTGRSARDSSDAPPRSDDRSRPPNKATLGSTSYDGADREPFEPDWGGASWYGTTSGTYWTLNPKEYADPRKHGPEYQARARRAAAARGAADPSSSVPADAAGAADDARDDARADERPGVPEPKAGDALHQDPGATAGPDAPRHGAAAPTHTTTSWWDATSGAPERADPRPMTATPESAPDHAAEAPPSRGEAPAPSADPATALAWAWLADDRPGLVARIGRALVAWVPVALGLGWVAGELSGCGRSAAACDPAMTGLVWVVQLGVLGLLLLVPRIAAVAAVGAMAAGIAAVPVAVLLTASGGVASEGGGDAAASAMLGGVVAIAWVGGLIVGAVRMSRRRAGPLS